MHDIKWIRENPTAFDDGLARRGLSPASQHLISIDERRRAIIRVLESWQATRNAASKEIGVAKKNKDEAKAQELMAKVAEAKESIPKLEGEEKAASAELEKALAEIPNLPSAEVPDGADEHGNVEHHHFGAKRNYPFTPKQHFELGEELRQMDFETAAKLSGARFVVLKSGLARMERAIGQFFIDVHTSEHGYMEIAPPLLVRDEVMYGTAQLPKFKDDQFEVTRQRETRTRETARKYLKDFVSDFSYWLFKNQSSGASVEQISKTLAKAEERFADTNNSWEAIDEFMAEGNLWLIPTAEVSLTNLVRESIVD